MTRPHSSLPVEVLRALARGDKIEAIKLVRQLTGQGLHESKDTVEGKRVHQGAQSPPHARLHVPPHVVPHAAPHRAADPSHRDAGHGLAPGEQPKASLRSSLIWWLMLLAAVGQLVYLYAR